MSLINVNGVGVLSGVINMPLLGFWNADLVIDQPDGTGFAAGTAAQIVAEDGITLNGTVVPLRTGSFLDSVHVRVIGGAGGMAKSATPRGYAQPGATVRDVLNGLMSDSGETLSSTIDPGFLATNLNAWSTNQGLVSQGLISLLDIVAPESNWRILGDGTLWIGIDTYPTLAPELVSLVNNPSEGTFDLGLDSPSVVPGINIQDIGNVNRVEHRISADKIRARVWVDLGGGSRGFASSVSSIVRQELSGLDFGKLYDATVVVQSVDGSTVDLVPADTRIGTLQRVPLRSGIAGITVNVAPGAILRLGWDRGDPSKPYACIWNNGATVTKETISALSLLLGGSSAIDGLLKTTTWTAGALTAFTTALGTFSGALSTFSGLCLGPTPLQIITMQAACTALATASTTLVAGTTAATSQVVKTI